MLTSLAVKLHLGEDITVIKTNRAFKKHTHTWLFSLIATLLGACSTSQMPLSETALEPTSVISVAWGEQVQVTHPAINASPAVTIQYRIDSGPVQTISRFHQQDNRVVFALPSVLALPELPNFATPYTVSAGAYASTLTSSQIEQYTNRGTVKVTISTGSKKIRHSYQPYGAVESGELTVLVQATNCEAVKAAVLAEGFSIIDNTSGERLCYLTAYTESKGTSQAIAHLENKLEFSQVWVDKNTIQTLDPTGAHGFDPGCDQIANWLDLAGGSGFKMLLPTDLLASSNASTAHNAGITGAGIKVFVIGGGIGINDDFECLDATGSVLFEDHDTHIAEIIRLIAPDALVEDRIVCDATGNCPTSEIVKALLDVNSAAQTNMGKDIINMSLGGPLPNIVLERALRAIESDITVISSNGNGPNAPAHYPASYSSANPTPGALDNVVAIAASGFQAGNWYIAGYNTRNAQMFAPGTNVCVQTATSFRCDTSATTQPESIGITGSSFAASFATAMAALYLEASSSNLTPEDVRQCLLDGSVNNPNMNRMVWFDAAVCP